MLYEMWKCFGKRVIEVKVDNIKSVNYCIFKLGLYGL